MASMHRDGRGILWTYAYEILPSQVKHRLRAIRRFLDAEHARADRESRTWVARMVIESRITHILVVSDSPDQEREINRRVEAALGQLGVGFAMTAPLAVGPSSPLPPK